MIQNPIIAGKASGSEELSPAIGTVTLSANSGTITIPVSNLYSHVALFTLDIIIEESVLTANTNGLQVVAITPDIPYNSQWNYMGCKVYHDTTDGLTFEPHLLSGTATTKFNFTSTEITITKFARNFPEGTYGYVAW